MSIESDGINKDKKGYTRREILVPTAVTGVLLLASCNSALPRSEPSWRVNNSDAEILSLLEQGERRARDHSELVGRSYLNVFGDVPSIDFIATMPEDPDPEGPRLMGIKFYYTETDLLLDLDKQLHIFPGYIEHYNDEESKAIFYHLLGIAVAGRNSVEVEKEGRNEIIGFTREGVDLEGDLIQIANGAEKSDFDMSISTGVAFLLGDHALYRATGENLFQSYRSIINYKVWKKVVGHTLITLELLSNYRDHMKINVDQAFFQLYNLFSVGDLVGFVRGVISREPTLQDIENVEMLYRKINNFNNLNNKFVPELLKQFRKEYGLPPATFYDYHELGDIVQNYPEEEQSIRDRFINTSKVL